MSHSSTHPLAEQTVTLNSITVDPQRQLVVFGAEFLVKDWVDHYKVGSFRARDWRDWADEGNWAVYWYLQRRQHRLPDDDEVVYGKINGIGHIVHQSEISSS